MWSPGNETWRVVDSSGIHTQSSFLQADDFLVLRLDRRSCEASIVIFGTAIAKKTATEGAEFAAKKGVQQLTIKVGKEGVKGALSVTVFKAAPHAVKNALRKFQSRVFDVGGTKFLLDKKGLSHILERHNPKYWNGTTKAKQTFFNPMSSVDDIVGVVESVMKQNASEFAKRGSSGVYPVRGVVDGVEYVLSVNRGRVGGCIQSRKCSAIDSIK